MSTFLVLSVFVSIVLIYAGIVLMLIEGRYYFFNREYSRVRFSTESGQSVDLYMDRDNSLESLQLALEILKENRARVQAP